RHRLTCSNGVVSADNSLIPNATFVPSPNHSARHPEGEFNEPEGSRWLALDRARAKQTGSGEWTMDRSKPTCQVVNVARQLCTRNSSCTSSSVPLALPVSSRQRWTKPRSDMETTTNELTLPDFAARPQ